MSLTAKAKVSLSIASGLIEQVDRSVAEKRYPSRSAAIETALRVWTARERVLSRDAAIEAYYLGASAGERADEKEWADLAYHGFVDISDQSSRRTPKRGRRHSKVRGK
jgi:Arc/MetJ-type ribon-helix-helix transcriptional regulator